MLAVQVDCFEQAHDSYVLACFLHVHRVNLLYVHVLFLSFPVEGRSAEDMSVETLYQISMKNKFIVSMTLPPMDENKYIFKTYKVTKNACRIEIFGGLLCLVS